MFLDSQKNPEKESKEILCKLDQEEEQIRQVFEDMGVPLDQLEEKLAALDSEEKALLLEIEKTIEQKLSKWESVTISSSSEPVQAD